MTTPKDMLIAKLVDLTDYDFDFLVSMSEHELVMVQAESGIIDADLAEEYGISLDDDYEEVSYPEPTDEQLEEFFVNQARRRHVRSQIRPFGA